MTTPSGIGFSSTPKKPAVSEEEKTLKKKREELARVLARLQDPNVSPGIAKELRKHVAILEAEIAELVGAVPGRHK